ncbi:MAG: hypothetical protein C5B50_21670 [Verrucomicrobia bacterium]|nr:MAG: hypothetical protein C5B50_21670 [Verrucomicrobiota bacterium]
MSLRTVLVVLAVTVPLLAGAEEKLPELKVGMEVYKDVTITEVTATHIAFDHSHGLGTAKLKDLEPAIQEHFHFDPLKAAAIEVEQAQADALYRHHKSKSILMESIAGLGVLAIVYSLCVRRIRHGLKDLVSASMRRRNQARHDEANARRILALTQVAAPFGERVACDERTGDPHPVSVDREGKFSLHAKAFCDVLKLEIDTSAENAAKIAALLAAL